MWPDVGTKVAIFCLKLSNKADFKSCSKSCQTFWLLFVEKMSVRPFLKISNLNPLYYIYLMDCIVGGIHIKTVRISKISIQWQNYFVYKNEIGHDLSIVPAKMSKLNHLHTTAEKILVADKV